MPNEEFLYRGAKLAGQLVCLIAAVVLLGGLLDPTATPFARTGLSWLPVATGLGLACAGSSLWLQHRGRRLRPARFCAATALMLAGAGLWGIFSAGHATQAWTELPLLLGLATGAAALLGLHRETNPPRASLPLWLAGAVLALAGGSLIHQCIRSDASGAGFLSPSAMAAGATGGLLLLGAGLLGARPVDDLPRRLLSPTRRGRLTRRGLIAALLAPAFLIAVRLALNDVNFTAGATVLAMIYVLGGLALALFTAETAIRLGQQRDNADQTRELFTARLQEQAAQLQETVGRRTHELRQANLHYQALNQRLELATRAASLGIWEWDATIECTFADKRFLEIYGLPESAAAGTTEEWIQRVHPEDRGRARAAFESVLAGADDFALTFRIVRPDHAVRHVESWGVAQRDAEGGLWRVIRAERDITAQHEVTQQTLVLNERLQLALRSSNYGVWMIDLANDQFVWDDRMLEIYGLDPDDFHGTRQNWINCLHPADAVMAEGQLNEFVASQGLTYDSAFRIVQPDGTVRHVEARGYLQRDALGRPLRLVGLNRDVTAEKTMLEALRLAEERWQLALQGSNDGVWDWNLETGLQYHDERWARMLGYEPGEIPLDEQGWSDLTHPEDLLAGRAAMREHFTGQTPLFQHEFRMRNKAGEWRWILSRGKVVSRAPGGRPLRVVGTHTDTTDRKNLEQHLRRTEELADEMSSLAHIGGWEADFTTRQVTWTAEVCRLLEVPENHPLTFDDFRKFITAEVLDTMHTAEMSPAGSSFDHELSLVTAKGRSIRVRVLGRAEPRPGQLPRVHGALQDITAQHQAETDRRQLESQLFHAQKMETLGTLSGGIAHDFNNLLTGIIGYHELAADSIPEDHPARACLAEARTASLRARELIDQILTFSRQSSNEAHEAVDLGGVIEEARRFLRATLPANISIETGIDPDCPRVLADVTQIHQVILNLGSNAAHAMREHGGTLRIGLTPVEIGPAHPVPHGDLPDGRYACLAVSDSGHGMDEVTLRRIFEPFFTTKNTREGTGLGLSVVHGIVRAHRGMIDVKSRLGAGATFRIYLPVAADMDAAQESIFQPMPAGQGELICVVDDEGIVGRFTKAALERNGYHTVIFESAEACLAAWAGLAERCRALVTDQTMPGMQGTELAAELRRLSPGLSVVLMSGYFSNISSDTLKQIEPVELLAKPFTTEQLAHAVHRGLQPAGAA